MRLRITIVTLLLAVFMATGFVCAYDLLKVDDAVTLPVPVYDFKVMTFNVRTFNLDNANNPNDSIPLRAPLMLKLIEDEAPDIIGVQEWLTFHEFELNETLLETYGYVGVGRLDGGIIGEMTAVFYRKKRFEMVSTDTFWLSETPDRPSVGWDANIPRICTTLILNDLESGKTISVSNTHLDHQGPLAREYGTKLVVERACESEHPAILMGDFNYDISHVNYQYCIDNMDDCRLQVDDAVTMNTLNSWRKDRLEPKGLPIDHIFVSKGDFNVKTYKVCNYLIDDLFPSDHFPVMVTVEVK